MKSVLKVAGGVVLGAAALLGVVYVVAHSEKKDKNDKNEVTYLEVENETK